MGFSLLLVVLSFGFGCRSYRQAEQRIVSDLNQALQRTVWQNKDVWLNTDTLQAYARLQEVMDAPATAVLHDVPTGYVASDTLVWLSTAGAANAADAETEADASCLTLSFRGYARCSAGMIFSLSQQKLPAVLLGAALLCGVFSVFRVRRRERLKLTPCNTRSWRCSTSLPPTCCQRLTSAARYGRERRMPKKRSTP